MRGLISCKGKLKRWVSSLTYPFGEPIMAARTFKTASSPMNSASPLRNEITAMLREWSDGEQHASDELIRAVYDQLRKQARRQLRREQPNHTFDTAALINEAYLKLVKQRSVQWQDRSHFFALAAELMRRILVDHARTKQRQKRGGNDKDMPLDEVITSPRLATAGIDVDLIALDEALGRLEIIDEQQVRVIELRYFAGLGIEETSEILKIAPATVKRDWASAKAWLKHELTR
jgi:RNA polymerase sigma factor (TIGR02999 family)